MKNKIEKHIGETYNYLTIIKILEIQGRNRYVLCRCKCGNLKKVRLTHLISNEVKSCGCRLFEKGKTGTHQIWSKNPRIDKIWNGMLYRCYDPKKDTFKHYGGRGIRVCDEWLPKNNGATNFYNWSINNGYKKGLTIERIDVNGNYEPSNCKWITKKEQMQNTRNSHKITINNQTKCLAQWLREFNICKNTFYYRKSIGYSDEEALTMEKMK